MSEESFNRAKDWDEVRRMAEIRPAMYIGDQLNAHRYCINEPLRSIWKAKFFRRAGSVAVDLSPTQYIVRAYAGPLIRPIQEIFSFGGHETLGETWQSEWREYRYRREKDEAWKQRSVKSHLRRMSRGWEYCLSGPTGPRLDQPSCSYVASHQLTWGIRTDDSLWCESYKDSKPFARPFLISEPSPVGLFVAAKLDLRWYTGLPFTENDAANFGNLSHTRRDTEKSSWRARPSCAVGEVTAHWHPEDNLVTEQHLTADGVREWL